MRILFIVLFAVLMSACSSLKFWGNDEVDELAPAKLEKFDETIRVEKLWSKGVSKRDKLISSLHPALSDGVVYAAGDNGVVIAVDASSGKTIWQKKLKRNLSGGVGVGGDLVLVADIQGRVFALDRSTGEQRWRSGVSREVLSAPASNGRYVAVQTMDGFVVGLDASNGNELWRYQTDIPSLTLRASTSPVMSGNTVVAGFASGKAMALNAANGALLWENRVALPKGRSELERMVDIAGSPVMEGDVVYVTSYQGRTAAISRGTGRAIWYQDMSSFQQPAFGQDQVYVSLANDEVRALRSNSGQEVWTNSQLKYRQLSPPGYAAGYVAVGDADGYLHVLSASDGTFAGRRKVDGSGVSAPILSDGQRVYVTDNDGGITAYAFERR
ncbi:MAG: outer membrane protein assembly factor BamB [Porticoccaceae bacterium]